MVHPMRMAWAAAVALTLFVAVPATATGPSGSYEDDEGWAHCDAGTATGAGTVYAGTNGAEYCNEQHGPTNLRLLLSVDPASLSNTYFAGDGSPSSTVCLGTACALGGWTSVGGDGVHSCPRQHVGSADERSCSGPMTSVGGPDLPYGAEGCIVSTPGTESSASTTGRCSFVATRAGGYAATGSWRITVARVRGSSRVTVYTNGTSPACMTNVLQSGNHVVVEVFPGDASHEASVVEAGNYVPSTLPGGPSTRCPA